jgi:hypothetical protein
MSELILRLLAICALVYAIKEIDGPWGIMSWTRNVLMRNRFVGLFFYKLLSCYLCLGFHAGWVIYIIAEGMPKVNYFLLWGLAGAGISLIFGGALGQLYKGLDDNETKE